jgi:hypothetical protein
MIDILAHDLELQKYSSLEVNDLSPSLQQVMP